MKAGPLSDCGVKGSLNPGMVWVRRAFSDDLLGLFCTSGKCLSPPYEGIHHSEKVVLSVSQRHLCKIYLPVLSWQTSSCLV
jgi:hypothetical protein